MTAARYFLISGQRDCDSGWNASSLASAAMVARMAQAVGLPNLILTHFSPRYQDRDGPLTLDDIEREAREHYSGTLALARDLATYELRKDGSLHLLS